MRIRRLHHSVYQLEYHVVWGTKYRRKLLKPYVKATLLKSFKQTQQLYPTLHVVNVNNADDHVHLLVEVAPSVSIAAMVQKLKAHASLELKRDFKFIRELRDGSVWSVGYFVSSVGINEKTIQRYIERQDKHDQGRNAAFEFS